MTGLELAPIEKISAEEYPPRRTVSMRNVRKSPDIAFSISDSMRPRVALMFFMHIMVKIHQSSISEKYYHRQKSWLLPAYPMFSPLTSLLVGIHYARKLSLVKHRPNLSHLILMYLIIQYFVRFNKPSCCIRVGIQGAQLGTGG